MHNHPNPLPDIPHQLEKLTCYSRLWTTEAHVFYPTQVAQLREIFDYAAEHGCRVTLRGGTHAFDEQSLGDDIVISMTNFDQIHVDPDQKLLTIGPGARWGDIVAELERNRLWAANTVTTSHASAGGTLSGDCLSRFSPAYGKEGKQILSFELVPVKDVNNGAPLVCTPPAKADPPANWTMGQHAFAGAIGGLGYLGAVTSITYRVYPITKPGKIRIATSVTRCPTYEKLVQELVPIAHQADLDPANPNSDLLDSMHSGLHAGRFGGESALLFTSRIDPGAKRRRLLLYRPRLWLRVPAEWFMRTMIGEWVMWRLFYGFVSTKKKYVDDLADNTFFMDGNVRAKYWGRKLFRRKMQTIQQTFVVPSDPRDEGGWSDAQNNLLEFLRYGHGVLMEKKLAPSMHDVLYLPADERFPLSATAELAGFAVSYAFETSSKRKQRRIRAAFEEMSDALLTKFGGRVHLTKNVVAKRKTLRAMYDPSAVRFFDVKHELDPHCVLRNRFLEKTFGELLYCDPPVVTGSVGLEHATKEAHS